MALIEICVTDISWY